MKRFKVAISVLVFAVAGVVTTAPLTSAARTFTPIHISSVDAMQDSEKYRINVKMNRVGDIVRDACKFANTTPGDKSKLLCTTVTSVAMVSNLGPDFPGTWASFSGMMDIYDSTGALSSTEAYTIYVQDNATPGDGADMMILRLGEVGYAITLTSGDFIVQ